MLKRVLDALRTLEREMELQAADDEAKSGGVEPREADACGNTSAALGDAAFDMRRTGASGDCCASILVRSRPSDLQPQADSARPIGTSRATL